VGRTLVSIQIPKTATYPFDDLRCVFGDVGQSVAILIPVEGYWTIYQCLSPPRTRTLLGSSVLDEVYIYICMYIWDLQFWMRYIELYVNAYEYDEFSCYFVSLDMCLDVLLSVNLQFLTI
jgi:hypothetical protein